MRTRRSVVAITRPLALAVSLLAVTGTASAQEFLSQNLIKPGEEKLTLNLGGILNQFSTHVTLNGQTTGGTDVDLENNGLKDRLSSFDASGTWRFFPRHRLDLQYFSAKRTGTRNYDTSITIGDNVYPIGATLSAEAKSQFFIADYRYSFIKTDAIEVAGLIGLYGAHFNFNFDAVGNESGNARRASTSSSTTVPLPILGASVDWYLTPRWKIAGSLTGMKADIDKVNGRVILGAAGTEYMFTRNLGAGLRYMYSEVDVDVTKSSFNGNVNWRMNSVMMYGKLLF